MTKPRRIAIIVDGSPMVLTVPFVYLEDLQSGDDYYNNNLTDEKIKYYKKILEKVANRDSVCQFFDKFPDKDAQYFLGRQEVSNQDFLGIILDYNKDKKNRKL